MTTEAAAQQYLQEHLSVWGVKGYEVYNPMNKDIEDLPVIYGFNNGGQSNWLHAVAISEDGHVLGGHVCSHESYMPYDLGIVKGSRKDRHEESYMKHYPDGYRMDFIGKKDVKKGHDALKKALDLYQSMKTQEKEAS